MRLAFVVAVLLAPALAGCSSGPPSSYWLLHVTGDLKTDAPNAPTTVACDPANPDTTIDPAAGTLDVARRFEANATRTMVALLWIRVTQSPNPDDCPPSTLFYPLSGDWTLPPGSTWPQLDVTRIVAGDGLRVNGHALRAGQTLVVPWDDVSRGVHSWGNLTITLEREMPASGVTLGEYEFGFGVSTPTKGYWRTNGS